VNERFFWKKNVKCRPQLSIVPMKLRSTPRVALALETGDRQRRATALGTSFAVQEYPELTFVSDRVVKTGVES